MTTTRETHETRLGAAWAAICDDAGMTHDGLYNVATQSPDTMRKIGETMFRYMTDMCDNNDAYSTRDIAALARFFDDVVLYAANSK